MLQRTDIIGMPKTHTHVHLDGSYPLDAVRELERRYGVEHQHRSEYQDVWDFFAAYGYVPSLVRSLDDLSFLCRALVAQEAALGVSYLEPAIEPQLYAPRLGRLEAVTETIVAALTSAGTEHGIAVGINLTMNTDQDGEIAEQLTGLALRFAPWGVRSFGTAGFVEPANLQRFRHLADRCKAAGLEVVAHAGQTGGPESILNALDDLGATRISHGINVVTDPDLLDRLAEEQIVCDVCPVSNVRLGLTPSLAVHPGRQMLAAGVPVTLNADDSLLFAADVADQYTLVQQAWQLSEREVASVAGNGALIRSMPQEIRQQFSTHLSEWAEALTEQVL